MLCVIFYKRTPQKEMPNIILFTECGYTQHDKTGSSFLWSSLSALPEDKIFKASSKLVLKISLSKL